MRRIPDPNDRARENLLRQLLPNPSDYRTAIHALSMEQTKILINPMAVTRSLKMVAPNLKRAARKQAVEDISYMAALAHTTKARAAGLIGPSEYELYERQNGLGQYRRQNGIF